MFDCPKCGAANPDGATFCGLCAQPFADEKPQESPQEKPKAEKVPWSSLEHGKYPTRQAVRRRRYFSFGVPIVVVVIAVLAVVLVMATRTNKVDGSAEFQSSSSGVSFKYPASWEKQDKSFLTHLSKGQDLSSVGNEIILVKRGEVFFQHLLTLSSETVNYGARSWNQILEGLKSGFETTSTDSSSSTFAELTLPPESGAKGVIETYYIDQKPELFEIEGYIVKGNISYTFIFATPLRGKATDETDARNQFFNIVNSLKFQ